MTQNEGMAQAKVAIPVQMPMVNIQYQFWLDDNKYLELIQSLIQLVLSDKISSVMTQLHHSLPHSPHLVGLLFVIHFICSIYSKLSAIVGEIKFN